jgi:hypothetical protein
MNICEEHKFLLRRGSTYSLTGFRRCEICKTLSKYSDFRWTGPETDRDREDLKILIKQHEESMRELTKRHRALTEIVQKTFTEAYEIEKEVRRRMAKILSE